MVCLMVQDAKIQASQKTFNVRAKDVVIGKPARFRSRPEALDPPRDLIIGKYVSVQDSNDGGNGALIFFVDKGVLMVAYFRLKRI